MGSYGGKLKEFPDEVVAKMLDRQQEQQGFRKVEVFEKSPTKGGTTGFSWNASEEGHEFWCQVIEYEKFDRFFKKYPRLSKFKGTPAPAGEFEGTYIEGYPLEIIDAMIHNVINQKRRKNAGHALEMIKDEVFHCCFAFNECNEDLGSMWWDLEDKEYTRILTHLNRNGAYEFKHINKLIKIEKDDTTRVIIKKSDRDSSGRSISFSSTRQIATGGRYIGNAKRACIKPPIVGRSKIVKRAIKF
jgi:hypothetical protein